MDRCEQIRNWHIEMRPKLQKTKEEARIHLAEIKELSQTANRNSSKKYLI